MTDHYKNTCSKCKYKEINENDSPCKDCVKAFFDDWKNPKRKLPYFKRKENKE